MYLNKGIGNAWASQGSTKGLFKDPRAAPIFSFIGIRGGTVPIGSTIQKMNFFNHIMSQTVRLALNVTNLKIYYNPI